MTSAEDIASDHVQFFSSNTKITALKSAVNSFIDVIAEDNPTSKIAIVKFAGDKKDTVGNDTYKEGRYTYNYTQIVQNLTEANTDGAASLKAAVNALTASGATAADYGLEKAIDVFGAAGQVPKDRNRVVIMFTDGEPNHDNGFDGRVAKAAIDKAKTLKNESYGASVYTIGIFDGASVGESLPANNDNGRTNRYMHLVSSNYPEASSMKDTGTGDVTKGFYKVASDANSLGSVFTQLGEAIGKPSIDLGSTAVLTDNIASNFIAPANVADVKVYTADYDGNSKTFGDWEDFPGDVKISGNAVTVTGFNYSANYVSETQHPGTDNDFGKKLIVEFKITVDRTKTYGGTQPANAGANITLDGETIASVGNPQVPVSIVNGFSASYTNSKTYDGNGFTIKDEFEAMLKKDNIADGEKNDYVNITYTVIDEKGGIVGTYVIEANKTTGTWTAGSAAAITSPDVGTYNYKVTCVVSDVNKENGAASVEASGTMTLSIAANTGLIVSGNNYTGKYDGASHGEAATANVDGATIEYSTDNGATWTDTVPTIKDVGEINVTVKASMANYSDATATYTLKVTPRTVTLTSETASKPYDGDPLTRPVVTIGGDGFVDGEVTDIKAIGSVTNVSDSPVTNTIVYTTTDEFVEDNYNITKDEGTLTITKSGELSVNAKGYDGKYDGQTHNGNVTATEGATLSYSTDGGNTWIATEPTIKNVGEINVTVKASMANYSDATATYTLKVTPRTVTLTSETASKTYDGTPLTRPVVTVTGDGFVDGEVTDIKATGSVTNVSEGSVTNTIVYTTTDKFVEDNYNITKAEGKLSITPLAVTVTAKDYTKYVGEKDPAFEATVTGTINNDTVSYTISREKGETAGTYSITPAGAEAQGNYTVTYNAGTLTINRRPYIPPVNPPITDKITVEITGNSDSVVYDGTEHSVKDYTVKISDSRYTEKDFTFSGKALASGVNAGAYEMGLKADQFKNTNARFTNVEFIIKADGVLTITQRPLTITAGSAEGIAPVTCDKYTVEGLATGDKVDSVKITGIQSEPGESPNVASDAVIKNAKGDDVTANYKITYVDGVLKAIEVLNKEIHFNYVIGYTDGTIRPNNNITRAETFAMINRVLDRQTESVSDLLPTSEMNMWSDNLNENAWYYKDVQEATNYHKCDRVGDSVYEKWTEKVPDIDWASYQI